MSEIIRGISEIDSTEQVVVADYRPRSEPGEGIHVVEMATARATHLDNKLIVFGRWITEAEHEDRQTAYQADAGQYKTDHLRSLSH